MNQTCEHRLATLTSVVQVAINDLYSGNAARWRERLQDAVNRANAPSKKMVVEYLTWSPDERSDTLHTAAVYGESEENWLEGYKQALKKAKDSSANRFYYSGIEFHTHHTLDFPIVRSLDYWFAKTYSTNDIVHEV